MRIIKEKNNGKTFKNIMEAAKWVHGINGTMINEVVKNDDIYEAIRATVNDIKDKTKFNMSSILEYDFVAYKAETNNEVGYTTYNHGDVTVFEYD